jgi:hypothetical protein
MGANGRKWGNSGEECGIVEKSVMRKVFQELTGNTLEADSGRI